MMLSSAPVTVTVCAVFQLAEVKVRDAGLTVASPTSPLLTLKTTLEFGGASSTTVKVSVVPDSSTWVDPPDSVTVNPA